MLVQYRTSPDTLLESHSYGPSVLLGIIPSTAVDLFKLVQLPMYVSVFKIFIKLKSIASGAGVGFAGAGVGFAGAGEGLDEAGQ